MDERKAHLMDEFGDAALALLLDEKAEADGAALWEEFRSQQTPIPPDLDAACQHAVNKAIQKSHKHMLMGRALKRSALLAACLTLVVSLVFSVEALRVPVLNFIITHGGKGSMLLFQEKEGWGQTPMEELLQILDSTLPEGYSLVTENIEHSDKTHQKTATCIARFYQNSQNHTLQIIVLPASGAVTLDTEDAAVTELTFCGHHGMFIENDDFQAIWVNETQYLFYQLTANGMEKEDFLEYAALVAEKTTYSAAGLSNE